MAQMDPMRAFVLGTGRFVDDLDPPGTLHLKIVRSPYARARVLSVRGAIAHRDFPATMGATGEIASDKPSSVSQPVLAKDFVQYAGQPVGAVVARDRYRAEDLLASVDVDYEPLKPIVDPEAALAGEPIHPGTTSNALPVERLGHRFALPRAPIVLEDRLANARVIPNPLETRGILASWDGTRLTAWASTQSIHSWREGLAESLGLPLESVRVIATDTGGAFGSKGGIYPEYAIAAHASMRHRRPVKWIEDRIEHLRATEPGRGVRARMKMYADRAGRVLGLEGDLLVDSGAYPTGSWMPWWVGSQLTGPYAIRKAFVEGRAVMTNKVPMGPYRGAGRPEAAFFIERMMDRLADEIGKDPVHVRRQNASARPFRSPLGRDVPAFRPFLEAAVRTLEYGKRRARTGVGFSSFLLVPGVSGGESVRILVRKGRVAVFAGGQSHGQGHETFVRDLVSRELRVPPDVIDVEKGDTDIITKGVGSWGSRSAMLIGASVVEAAEKIRRQAKAKKRGDSGPALLEGTFDVTVSYRPTQSLVSFGANLVVASLDRTGRSEVRECRAYYDVGQPLNLAMVRSQIIGGSVQGIGQVLYEDSTYDENGQPMFASLSDVGLPTAVETSTKFVVSLAESMSPLPHGAKGVGESPTIGVPPALVRALETLRGMRLTHTPLTLSELSRLPPRPPGKDDEGPRESSRVP